MWMCGGGGVVCLCVLVVCVGGWVGVWVVCVCGGVVCLCVMVVCVGGCVWVYVGVCVWVVCVSVSGCVCCMYIRNSCSKYYIIYT